ncbi:unnamed protein product [Moneuplotes crassus]|uniref:Uncharacterized protein n=1 Tax=Euplotes crassus TaxID=5936 RepID=A0AAD2D6J6_EUPCR|nr:unnamed protein product [Moneuplotes crassus]
MSTVFDKTQLSRDYSRSLHPSPRERQPLTKYPYSEELEEREKVQRLENRLESAHELIHSLRLGYYKELNSLRQLLDKKHQERENFEYLEIRFFTPTDGLDDRVIDLLNTKIIEIKDKYEEHIHLLGEKYEFLEKQIEAYNKIDPNLISITDPFSADMLIMKMTLVEKRPRHIWNLIEKHYGKNFFRNTAHFVYGLSEKDVDEIFREQEKNLNEYKTKTLAKMSQLCEESEIEIARLRKELDDKNQKHSTLEAKYFQGLKESRKDAKEQIRTEYEELYNCKFQMFDIERQEMCDEMKELKNTIRRLGSGILPQESDEGESPVKSPTKAKNQVDEVNPTKITKYKSMIQEKFEQLAYENSKNISRIFELEKEAELVEAHNKSLSFENESLKQECDRLKTDIKFFEMKEKGLRDQIAELDKENDILEGKLIKIALNKLNPDELLRFKNKLESAGIKFEGKAQDTYVKLTKKSQQTFEHVDNEANKRRDNIYLEDYKPKSIQTNISGTYGDLIRVNSEASPNHFSMEKENQCAPKVNSYGVQTDIEILPSDEIAGSILNSFDRAFKAGNDFSEIIEEFSHSQNTLYKKHSHHSIVPMNNQEVQTDCFDLLRQGIDTKKPHSDAFVQTDEEEPGSQENYKLQADSDLFSIGDLRSQINLTEAMTTCNKSKVSDSSAQKLGPMSQIFDGLQSVVRLIESENLNTQKPLLKSTLSDFKISIIRLIDTILNLKRKIKKLGNEKKKLKTPEIKVNSYNLTTVQKILENQFNVRTVGVQTNNIEFHEAKRPQSVISKKIVSNKRSLLSTSPSFKINKPCSSLLSSLNSCRMKQQKRFSVFSEKSDLQLSVLNDRSGLNTSKLLSIVSCTKDKRSRHRSKFVKESRRKLSRSILRKTMKS